MYETAVLNKIVNNPSWSGLVTLGRLWNLNTSCPQLGAQGYMGEQSIQHTEGTEDMTAEWTGFLPSMHTMERWEGVGMTMTHPEQRQAAAQPWLRSLLCWVISRALAALSGSSWSPFPGKLCCLQETGVCATLPRGMDKVKSFSGSGSAHLVLSPLWALSVIMLWSNLLLTGKFEIPFFTQMSHLGPEWFCPLVQRWTNRLSMYSALIVCPTAGKALPHVSVKLSIKSPMPCPCKKLLRMSLLLLLTWHPLRWLGLAPWL